MSEKVQTQIIEADVLGSLEDMTSSIELLAQSIRGLAFQIYQSSDFDDAVVFDRGLEQ